MGGRGNRLVNVGRRFIHNHARAIVACDLFTSVTATFQVLYVFVAIEIGSRRILHGNVTDHPNADWTRQQFREFLDGESGHRYLIHDRDSVFSVEVDAAVKGFGLRGLKTPVRSPMANAHCERVIGSIRRECLDYLIPLNVRHLQRILREFITHYNRGRPNSALGLVFLNRSKQLSLPVAIDIDCRRATVLHIRRCSVAYIMNIAWSRMLHNGLEYFRITTGTGWCFSVGFIGYILPSAPSG